MNAQTDTRAITSALADLAGAIAILPPSELGVVSVRRAYETLRDEWHRLLRADIPAYAIALANARAQAASVANPVTREQLRESLAVAETARLEMEESRELAEEERVNRIIVAREGSL